MILTGRGVGAAEAAAIGLANRVVPAGQALAAAQELAAQLAAFPQTCLRSDRASVLDAEGLDEAAALASEFEHGRAALASEAGTGAARFTAGAGRHGTFDARLRDAETRFHDAESDGCAACSEKVFRGRSKARTTRTTCTDDSGWRLS